MHRSWLYTSKGMSAHVLPHRAITQRYFKFVEVRVNGIREKTRQSAGTLAMRNF